MKLFYRDYGKGEAVIIVHGLFGMSDNWIPIAKKLAKDYHVCLLDLRNHGQSPHCKIYTYNAMSDDLYEFMNDAKIEKATLIGHSMGGKAVMQFATDFPEKVNKLVVLDTSPKEYLHNSGFIKKTINHQDILNKMQAFNLKKANSRKEISDYFKANFKDDFIIQLIQKNITKDKEKQFVWKLNVESLLNNLKEIKKEIKFENKQNIKTLFVFGSNSPYFNEEDKIKIENIPNTSIQVIKEAEHFFYINFEKELSKIILSFK